MNQEEDLAVRIEELKNKFIDPERSFVSDVGERVSDLLWKAMKHRGLSIADVTELMRDDEWEISEDEIEKLLAGSLEIDLRIFVILVFRLGYGMGFTVYERGEHEED